MSRDFRTDFLAPAISGLSKSDMTRVALALDCAIAFGALEARDGNESLSGPADALQAEYLRKVARLARS